MKKLSINQKRMKRMMIREKIRRETGINPEAINRGALELQQATNGIENLANWPHEKCAPLDTFAHSLANRLGDVRTGLTFFLVAQYQKAVPPNVHLNAAAFTKRMMQEVGANKFDARVMEDQVVETMENPDVIAFKQILQTVREMLPKYEADIDDIQVGNKLILHAQDVSIGDGIAAVGRLSRIILCNEKASTVQACKIQPRLPQYGVVMIAGEPIRQVNWYSGSEYGLMDIEYDTPENARKLAEVIMGKKNGRTNEQRR